MTKPKGVAGNPLATVTVGVLAKVEQSVTRAY